AFVTSTLDAPVAHEDLSQLRLGELHGGVQVRPVEAVRVLEDGRVVEVAADLDLHPPRCLLEGARLVRPGEVAGSAGRGLSFPGGLVPLAGAGHPVPLAGAVPDEDLELEGLPHLDAHRGDLAAHRLPDGFDDDGAVTDYSNPRLRHRSPPC